MAQPADLAPTYTARAGGLPAWATPDPTAQPVAHIQHRVEFRVLGYLGEWAQIECSNGWRAWVDGRAPGPYAPAVRPRSAINPVITRIGRYAITPMDLVPAVVVVVSALLPWLRQGGASSNGFKVPVTFLVDTTPSQSPIKAGIVLAVLAVIAVAAPARAVRFCAYAIALATFVLYIVQLQRVLHDSGAAIGLGSVLGAGVYVGIAASCIGLGWLLFGPRQP
jgi:hypothetical protein